MNGERNDANSLLSGSAAEFKECTESFKFTRDFDLYLDMLNLLKNEYLIIMCLKNTTGQCISEKTIEKIRQLGFVNYTAEPDMKYAGISYNGRIVYDSASATDKPPISVDVNVRKRNFCVSFEGKEAEIKIDGTDMSLNDKGINIMVYDCKNSELTDVSCYDASEEGPDSLQKMPEFYHRNPYYDKQYIDSHIFVSEKYKDSITLPIRRSYYSNRKLNVQEIERGIFLPRKFMNGGTYGGVCDENFNFIAGHQILNPRSHKRDDDRHISGSYEVQQEDIVFIDETVLYGGSLIEHPGHLITESFADRLWWLVRNPDSDIKIAVEIIWGKSVWSMKYNSFVTEFFDAFGVSRDRLIVIEKPTQFKKIIIPDQSAIPLNYCFPYEFTDEYIKVFQHITKRLTPGKYRKIYLTKSKTYKKTVIGEEFFTDFFENKGFKIVNPEDYTLKEKAELMYGADEVVTIDGTNSLFTVFCKPSTRLTILTRRLDFWDTPQQLITEAAGIKDFFLVNTVGNFLDNFSDDPFGVYSSGLTAVYASEEFRKYVKYVYNEELDVTPEESLKSILYEYISYFPVYYSDPTATHCLQNMKVSQILQSMCEVVLGKGIDELFPDFSTHDEQRLKKLEKRLHEENRLHENKIKLLSERAKEFIEENAALKRSLAQLEAEKQQLLEKNAELTAYMTEINSLLDSLEAGNGTTDGE